VKKDIEEGRSKSKHKTIFHQLLNPKAAGGHVVPGVEGLTNKVFTILTTAADITGHVMALLTFYVASNPAIYSTLVAELEAVFPDASKI
jgi:hypothetical protein